MGEEIQISLAFLAGLAMCLWGVCYLPAVAGLTTEKNRASGFGLIFSASIGTSSLGGVLCGYFPQWLRNVGFAMQAVEAKRLILLVSCAIAALGLFPVLRMQLTMPQAVTSIVTTTQAPRTRPPWKASSFLLRFLPSMALWTAVLASFTPFANVYLSRELHVPLSRIGLVFSAAQILQLCVVLLSPMLFRKFGLVKGIVATQILTSIALACLAATQNGEIAMAMFLSFSALQWMCTPGLYNLLMSSVPDVERSTASSMTMFCNAVMQSVATVIAGSLFVRFGYPHVLAGIAVLAVVAAALFLSVVGPVQRHASIQP
jgi:predicted MFS family arabinose efflux permease